MRILVTSIQNGSGTRILPPTTSGRRSACPTAVAIGSRRMIAIAADASITVARGRSVILRVTRLIAVSIEPNRGNRVGRVGVPLAQAIPDLPEPLEGGIHPGDPGLDVIFEPATLLDRDENGHRAMITLDEEALAGGRLVEDLAERAPKVERGDGSHGQP